MVKSLFNIILYGGTIKTWVKTWDLKEGEFETTNFAYEFQREVQEITSVVVKKEQFKELKLAFYKYKSDKKRQQLGGKFDEEKFELSKGKYLSAILQDCERLIIVKVMTFLEQQNVKVSAY